EHAIVRGHKMMAITSYNKRSTLSAYTRIDYYEVNRSIREIRISLRDRERAIEHIKGLHGMADIHDLDIRDDVENHAFNRPNEVIVKTEVGSQSDDRPL